MSKVIVEDILEIIKNAHVVKDVNMLDIDKPLSEQGMDSLDYSGVLFSVDEAFDVEIPDEDVDKLLTVNDIVSYINSKS